MPLWLQQLAAIAVVIVLAPLIAFGARRYGRQVRGGFMMAGILLGFGEVVDPPSKHIIEAQEGEEKGSPETRGPK
jgi:Kef-type K+ transport system membrane component KefB